MSPAHRYDLLDVVRNNAVAIRGITSFDLFASLSAIMISGRKNGSVSSPYRSNKISLDGIAIFVKFSGNTIIRTIVILLSFSLFVRISRLEYFL